jgi:hypothetical protein
MLACLDVLTSLAPELTSHNTYIAKLDFKLTCLDPLTNMDEKLTSPGSWTHLALTSYLDQLSYLDLNVTCRDFTFILSRPALSRVDSLTYLDLKLTCLLRISVSGVPGASSSCHCHSGSPVAVAAFAL